MLVGLNKPVSVNSKNVGYVPTSYLKLQSERTNAKVNEHITIEGLMDSLFQKNGIDSASADNITSITPSLGGTVPTAYSNLTLSPKDVDLSTSVDTRIPLPASMIDNDSVPNSYSNTHTIVGPPQQKLLSSTALTSSSYIPSANSLANPLPTSKGGAKRRPVASSNVPNFAAAVEKEDFRDLVEMTEAYFENVLSSEREELASLQKTLDHAAANVEGMINVR